MSKAVLQITLKIEPENWAKAAAEFRQQPDAPEQSRPPAAAAARPTG